MTGIGREDPDRLATGISGLDLITGGGLVRAIYLVIGARKRRVLYATLLAETHTRLISQVRQFPFFEEAALGKDLIDIDDNGLRVVAPFRPGDRGLMGGGTGTPAPRSEGMPKG